jgi:hypothetical protein
LIFFDLLRKWIVAGEGGRGLFEIERIKLRKYILRFFEILCIGRKGEFSGDIERKRKNIEIGEFKFFLAY